MSDEASVKVGWRSTRDVLIQIVREMGVPFLIAATWTIYSLVVAPQKRNLVDAISLFGGAFFLTCWAFSQWFRVRKQQAVESGLSGIVKKQEALVAALADASERLEGHASGGRSVGWLMLSDVRDGGAQRITALVEGKYPLLDAKALVLDLAKSDLGANEFQRTREIRDFFKHHEAFDCGMLQPTHAMLQKPTLSFDTSQPVLRFKVDWMARNGIWFQYIELKWNGHQYVFYTAIERDGQLVFENPPRGSVPKLPDGRPDVFWHMGLYGALAGHTAQSE